MRWVTRRITQQATVVAYHLLRNDGVDRALLGEEWKELGADAENPSVYRRPVRRASSAWLEATSRGEGAATVEPSSEPAARVYPVGVWFRRDPDAADECRRLGCEDHPHRRFDGGGAAAIAGAVAASSFAQVGRDLVARLGRTDRAGSGGDRQGGLSLQPDG